MTATKRKYSAWEKYMKSCLSKESEEDLSASFEVEHYAWHRTRAISNGE